MQHHSPRCASVPQQQQSASVRYQHTARVSLRPQKCRQPPFSSHAAAFTRLSHHTCSANRPSTGLTTPKKSRQTITCALPPEHDVAAAQKKLAVFVSGGGSNFKAIHSACLAGHINATVAVVVSDVPSCGGVSYAKDQGIPTLTYPASKKGLFPGLSKEQLVQELTDRGVDYVILAGYLKLIPEELVRCYKRKMLNIHPGLLPSFGGHGMYGERVHAAVIKSGARFSGPTVHFVDEEYDTGPILAQRCVPVYPTDSPKKLAARVLEQEHKVYPYAVSALVDGRVTWREDGIPIIWEAH